MNLKKISISAFTLFLFSVSCSQLVIGKTQDALVSVPFETQNKTLTVHGTKAEGNINPLHSKPVAGVIGKALDFDGSEDQAAEIRSNALNLRDELTVSTWIKPTEQEGIQTIISRNWNWRLRIENGGINVTLVGDPYPKNGRKMHSTEGLHYGDWNHVVFTFSRSQQKASLFINGKQVISESGIDFRLRDEKDTPLLIGMDPENHNPYTGAIDELHVYDKAFSLQDVKVLFSEEGKNLFHRDLTEWQQQLEQSRATASSNPEMTQLHNNASAKLEKFQNTDEIEDYWQAREAVNRLVEAVTDYTYYRSLTEHTGKQGITGVATFITRPFSNEPILPETHLDFSLLSGEINLQGSPSEVLTGSFVLIPQNDIQDLKIEVTDIEPVNGNGRSISSESIKIRAIKHWFQGATAWKDVHAYSRNQKRVLVPELLLHDTSIVKIDREKKLNYVKLSDAEGERYADINGNDVIKLPGTLVENNVRYDYPVTEFPVKDDADTLQPLNIKEKQNQQFWLNVDVPTDTPPGTYRTKLNITSSSGVEGHLTLTIQVLPITLGLPTTRYDLNKQFTHAVYYRGIISDSGEAYVGSVYKSEKQYRAELQNLREHGIDFVQNRTPLKDEKGLARTLAIQKEILGGDTLYYSGTSNNLGIRLETDAKAFSTLEKRAKTLKRIAEGLGYKQIYTYGIDELAPEKVQQERAIWERLNELGVGVYVAGKKEVADHVGDALNVLVSVSTLSTKTAEQMHKHGNRIFSYGNPQSGVESPKPYRMNYGIKLWLHNYDGAMTYAYQSAFGTSWSDFDDPRPKYRNEIFAYPTSNGVIDTIAWEGYSQAKRDVQYISHLHQQIQRWKDSDKPDKKQMAIEAQSYIDSLSIDMDTNLDEVRDAIIQHILKLSDVS